MRLTNVVSRTKTWKFTNNNKSTAKALIFLKAATDANYYLLPIKYTKIKQLLNKFRINPHYTIN